MIDVKPRWWLSFDGACLAAAALFGAWVGWGEPNQELTVIGLALWWTLTWWFMRLAFRADN